LRPSDPSGTAGFQTFLRRHHLLFAAAESCTGGLLSRQLSARAGSSDVFWGGAVTYADGAKTSLLGVDPDLIRRRGAVSGEVASAMVRGLLERSPATLAVAVTGIAGPGGGSPAKPVGTVWFGLGVRTGSEGRTAAVRLNLDGGRARIQADACRWARVLARTWWSAGPDLDSLQTLTDNVGKPAVAASYPPFFFPLSP